MIAVDANILIYAQRMDSPWYRAADERIKELAEGPGRWTIPWPCVHEFFSVSTNPKIWPVPTPPILALNQMESWMSAPGFVPLSEGLSHWKYLRPLIEENRLTGPAVHDARIAAICMEHGVSALWSADRDFSKFAGLKIVNPLR